MITFLSGGTGTPKLLQGARQVLYDSEISVVVNTAEDIWLSGNHISPDLDTVMYLFAGILNTETWWGIRGDTFSTHRFLEMLGGEEFIAVGDKDRAVHIARANLLMDGMTLTEATDTLCRRLSIEAPILPMTDTEVMTYVETPEGPMHFQDYWVKHRGEVEIEAVVRRYDTPPAATDAVMNALEASTAVVIGPSNPVTSISPILACEGVKEALMEQFVVAVSPFIGDVPVSGPAAALMRASGMEPSSAGTYSLYKDFVDLFINDVRDPVEIDGALRIDTLMSHPSKSEALAWEILSVIRSAVQ